MQKKIRLLWVGHFAPFPAKGGSMQRSYNMVKQCSQFSSIDFISLLPISKVNAFYSNFDHGVDEITEKMHEFCGEVHLIRHGYGTRNINKSINVAKSIVSKDPYDVVALFSEELASVVNEKIKKNSYDIIYVDTIGLCPMINASSNATVLNHHNIESEMLYRRASQSGFLKGVFIKWQAKKTQRLEKKYTNNYSLNFTCSEMDSKRLGRISNCKSVSIPNGVDLTYFTRSKPYRFDETAGAIFAGGLDWYPNASAVDYIVEKIAPRVSEELQDFMISVYGKGSHKNLERAVQQSNIKIEKGGFVDDIRVPMEKARMYLCPITDGGGTKLKVLDALAMGIPLIADPIACEGIDVIDGEHVIFAETESEYLEAIKRLNSDSQLAEKLSRAGIELIEKKYSYDFIGSKLKNALLGLAN